MSEGAIVTEPGESSNPWWMRAIFGKDPRVTLIRLLLTIGLILVLAKWVFVPIEIVGKSMEPAYVEGKRNLINQWAYVLSKPKRGDVVAVHTEGQSYMLLKRIVGLPGEYIVNIGGYVFVNGQLLEEPYVEKLGGWQFDDLVLEEDFYYLIGDNRRVTAFGRRHGRHIVGKVLF